VANHRWLHSRYPADRHPVVARRQPASLPQWQELFGDTEGERKEPSILLGSWRCDLREGVNFSFVCRRP